MEEEIMFGAGCFWGVEYAFQKIKGVVKTEVGYSGGKMVNPSYEDISSDETGHVEVVKITYDNDKIELNELMDVFWKAHDPTTPNMQWPDVGSQYRSVVFYYTPEQKKIIEESKKEWQRKIPKKIVTEIIKAGIFYKAEDYHQNYVKTHGVNSCHIAKNPYV